MSTKIRYLQTGAVDRLAEDGSAERKVSWVFSNEDVALDSHTIRTAGWELDDFLRNPVLLFAHDELAPPIGKVTRIEKRGSLLVGDTVFADAETYPFADTVYRLVRGGFLNATSVSWFPLEFRAAKDRSRPDGIDFLRQKLLEISVVPVPANPAALATARAMGVNVAPLREWAEQILDGERRLLVPRAEVERVYQETKMATGSRAAKEANWKCGASSTLPLDEDSSWDGPAAAKSIFEACKFDSDKPDLGKAKKAFLAYDDANPKERGSYKLPFAKIVDGRMVAVASGIRAAASRLPKTDIPDDVAEKARKVIDSYEAKMKKGKDERAVVTKRGLEVVSSLAYLMAQAGYLKGVVDREEANENDADSPSPENLLAVLHALGNALLDMVAEEVEELLEQYGPLVGADDDDGDERAIKAFFKRAGKKLSKAAKDDLEQIHDHARGCARLMRAHIDHYADNEDKDLSDDDTRQEMVDHAEAVHSHCMRTARMIRNHIDGRAPEDDGEAKPAKSADDGGKPAENGGDGQGGESRSAEERRKKAAALHARALIDAA